MVHPGEGLLHAYLDDAFAPDDRERRRIEVHLAACPDCQTRLEEACALRDEASGILAFADPSEPTSQRLSVPETAMHPIPTDKQTLPPGIPSHTCSTRPSHPTRTGRRTLPPGIRSRTCSTRPSRRIRTDRRMLPLAWAASLALAVTVGWLAHSHVGGLPHGTSDRPVHGEAGPTSPAVSGSAPAESWIGLGLSRALRSSDASWTATWDHDDPRATASTRNHGDVVPQAAHVRQNDAANATLPAEAADPMEAPAEASPERLQNALPERLQNALPERPQNASPEQLENALPMQIAETGTRPDDDPASDLPQERPYVHVAPAGPRLLAIETSRPPEALAHPRAPVRADVDAEENRTTHPPASTGQAFAGRAVQSSQNRPEAATSPRAGSAYRDVPGDPDRPRSETRPPGRRPLTPQRLRPVRPDHRQSGRTSGAEGLTPRRTQPGLLDSGRIRDPVDVNLTRGAAVHGVTDPSGTPIARVDGLPVSEIVVTWVAGGWMTRTIQHLKDGDALELIQGQAAVVEAICESETQDGESALLLRGGSVTHVICLRGPVSPHTLHDLAQYLRYEP